MPNTREKLIELICSTKYGNGSLIGKNFQKGFVEKIADHLISHGVTFNRDCHWATEQAYKNGKADALKWIPVTERLPENKKCVLMYSADGGVAEGVYEESRKRWVQWRWSVFDVPQVTHWMPLPEPPKGE